MAFAPCQVLLLLFSCVCRAFHISVEGWRFIPHSYSIVNQFQLLELVKRDDVKVTVRDTRFYKPSWTTVEGLLSPEAEAIIKAIPETLDSDTPDLVLRMNYPLDLVPAEGAATWVFGTTELKTCWPPMKGTQEIEWKDAKVMFWTPSLWSAKGFMNSGVDEANIKIVPHGVDTKLYRPASVKKRSVLREQLGWAGKFVFLNIGAMTGTKGVGDLVQAFGKLSKEHPTAKLVLKGQDMIYNSKDMMGEEAHALMESGQIQYIGDSLSFQKMAELYQAADVYVSPYRGEAFNMPVLEAAASGLIVICSKGGPTDDFTSPSFALPIDSVETDFPSTPGASPGAAWLLPDPHHLYTQMVQAFTNETLQLSARRAGPAFVRSGFTWKIAVDQLVKAMKRSVAAGENTCDWA
jgi:glycosyltransferase involved in cell wall biosynthesis